ncbi:MAG: aminotransferase class V-fold PLP-dependent enzyme [Clostridiaceae bacterium]|nr:aminotransferase class V-fold PLP-dependent enzyme [Clostridiaceae bacterium]
MIYLDNAATSWPKPPQVIQAMADFLRRGCANPGRGAHIMARQADEAVLNTRELLAKLFNIPDPMRISFMPNATMALNMAIHGVVQAGFKVVATMMEHNSVLRPLKTLEKAGIIQLELIKPERLGEISIQSIRKEVDNTKDLFCMTLSSNVTGSIMPVAEAGRHCRANGVIFLVDASQGAGVIPLDCESMCIDLLAFSGHKDLLGPQGTGGLYVRDGIKIKPLVQGGTGSYSERLTQPEIFPDSLESGTLNVPGIVGLGKGIQFILDTGISNIRARKQQYMKILFENLEKESRIKIYSPHPEENSGILSFDIERLDSSEAGYLLDKKFGICSRSGLHCSPLAHRSLNTHEKGLIRLSPGYFNEEIDIDLAVKAIQGIVRGLD